MQTGRKGKSQPGEQKRRKERSTQAKTAPGQRQNSTARALSRAERKQRLKLGFWRFHALLKRARE